MPTSHRRNNTVLNLVFIVVALTMIVVAAWGGDRVGRAQATQAGNYADTRVVYLTFDDGPDGNYTREVLTDLQAVGAHATFFEVGENMAANCPLMKEMLASGNQLGTHSWDHPKFAKLNADQTATEINRARLEQLHCTGHDSLLFRYPYDQPGTYGSAYLGSQLMLAIGSGIDPSDWDWQHVSDAEVVHRVMSQVYPGAIVQLHDGMAATGRDHGHPGYLPRLLHELKAQGYAMVTIPSQGSPSSGHE